MTSLEEKDKSFHINEPFNYTTIAYINIVSVTKQENLKNVIIRCTNGDVYNYPLCLEEDLERYCHYLHWLRS